MRLVGVWSALTCAKTEAAFESAAPGEMGATELRSGMDTKKRSKVRIPGSVRWVNILLALGEYDMDKEWFELPFPSRSHDASVTWSSPAHAPAINA